MADSETILKAHCNRCLRETRHSVLASRAQDYDEREDNGQVTYWEITQYQMLECCGCENITFRSVYQWVGDPDSSITYFPPAVTRAAPAWLSDIAYWYQHEDLRSLLGEVYAALHAGSNRLAMMGARTLIDMVMLDKIGDQGTFEQKLKKMETEGHISLTNREYLQAAIDAGSAAVHRGHCPDDKDVNRVMDIVENLVQAVYVLAPVAVTLRQNTPPRPPRPGAT